MAKKIIKLVKTCDACPSQWEAVTRKAKKPVYIRYRCGGLRLDIDEKSVVGLDYGDGMSGSMTTKKMLKLLRPWIKLAKEDNKGGTETEGDLAGVEVR